MMNTKHIQYFTVSLPSSHSQYRSTIAGQYNAYLLFENINKCSNLCIYRRLCRVRSRVYAILLIMQAKSIVMWNIPCYASKLTIAGDDLFSFRLLPRRLHLFGQRHVCRCVRNSNIQKILISIDKRNGTCSSSCAKLFYNVYRLINTQCIIVL